MANPTIQQRVAAFEREAGTGVAPAMRILDVLSELGEVAKEVLVATDYGRRPFVRNDAFVDELGDLLFSIVSLANATEVDVETGLDRTLAKYRRRLTERATPGSA